MTSSQKKRALYVSLILLSSIVIISLILFALRQNINLFYTTQEVASNLAPIGKKIRIGGMIKEKTIKKDLNLNVDFVVTDYKEDVNVKYNGILPDLFKEKQGVVMIGKLKDKKNFIAEQILAKHDENYMPKELS